MRTSYISTDLHTPYVSFSRSKCRACWRCVSACSNQVLGKVNFFFHRHVAVVNPAACSGCLACLKVCPGRAVTKMNPIEDALK